MAKKPTNAELAEQLATMTERAMTAEREKRDAEGRVRLHEEARARAIKEVADCENELRDAILRLTTENARLRGYLDRIEDETPEPRAMRYGRARELDERNRNTGRDIDHFARMGMGASQRRPWHHR